MMKSCILLVLILSVVNAQVFKKTFLKNHRIRISRNSEPLKNTNETSPKRAKEYEVSDQYHIDQDDGEIWYPIIELHAKADSLEIQPEDSKENAVETTKSKDQQVIEVQNIRNEKIEESNSKSHQEQVDQNSIHQLYLDLQQQSEKAREIQRKLDSDNFTTKHDVVVLDTDSQSLKELAEIAHQRVINIQKVHQALHSGLSDQEFEQIEKKEIQNSKNITEEIEESSGSEEYYENGFQPEIVGPVEIDNNGIIEPNANYGNHQQIQDLNQNVQSNDKGVKESYKTIKKVKTFKEEIEEKEDIFEPGKKQKMASNDLLNDMSEQRTKRKERVVI